MMNPSSFVKQVLPQLKVCGDYALRVQSQVKSLPAKGSGSEFSQALSNADLSVQNVLEVFCLSRFPECSFYGEEDHASLNKEYFVKKSDYCITLDPIDGTRLFLDGKPSFNIVLSLLHKGQIVAAICAIPGLNECYFAVEGLGAFRIALDEELLCQSWQPYQLPQGSDLILTHQEPELYDALSSLNVFEVIERYQLNRREFEISLASVLTGKLGAFVNKRAHVIDWGAIGYIIKQAGGELSDFSGATPGSYDGPDYRVQGLIASSNQQLHRQILEAINTHKN